MAAQQVPGRKAPEHKILERIGAVDVGGVWRLTAKQLQNIPDDVGACWISRMETFDPSRPDQPRATVLWGSLDLRHLCAQVDPKGDKSTQTQARFAEYWNEALLSRPALLSVMYAAQQRAKTGEQHIGHLARKVLGSVLQAMCFTPLDVEDELPADSNGANAGCAAPARLDEHKVLLPERQVFLVRRRVFLGELLSMGESAASPRHAAQILRAYFTERYTTSLVTLVGLPAETPADDAAAAACSWPVLHQACTDSSPGIATAALAVCRSADNTPVLRTRMLAAPAAGARVEYNRAAAMAKSMAARRGQSLDIGRGPLQQAHAQQHVAASGADEPPQPRTAPRVSSSAISGSRRRESDNTAVADVWHEVVFSAGYDPVTLEDCLVVTETDVSALVRLQGESSLLRSLLPKSIIERLLRGETDIAKEYDCVTVLFADVVGFTSFCSTTPAAAVVRMMNSLFGTFDALLEPHGVFRAEVIGDGYMCVAGHESEGDNKHASRMLAFATDLIEAVAGLRASLSGPQGGFDLQVRVGMHTGPVVAGVVGTSPPRFTFYGDTVNVASRMESHGWPGCVHLSKECASALVAEGESAGHFIAYGVRQIKGKGPMRTFLACCGAWRSVIAAALAETALEQQEEEEMAARGASPRRGAAPQARRPSFVRLGGRAVLANAIPFIPLSTPDPTLARPPRAASCSSVRGAAATLGGAPAWMVPAGAEDEDASARSWGQFQGHHDYGALLQSIPDAEAAAAAPPQQQPARPKRMSWHGCPALVPEDRRRLEAQDESAALSHSTTRRRSTQG